jgi:hypothetical protein
MALSNQELLSELSAKPIMEIVELVKMLEDSWGVSAAAPVAVAAVGGGGAAAAAVEEQTEFTVTLKAFGEEAHPQEFRQAGEHPRDVPYLLAIQLDSYRQFLQASRPRTRAATSGSARRLQDGVPDRAIPAMRRSST